MCTCSLNRSDVEGSFSIITSPQNQRIERYWSILQRDRIGWWRRFFTDLTDVEMVDTSDPVDLDCIRYYFMPLIRDYLNSILRQWNTHIISRRSNGGPSGRQDCMFYLPHLYWVESCLHTVKPEDIADFYPVATSDVSEEFQEIVEHFRMQDGFENPTVPSEALNFLPA